MRPRDPRPGYCASSTAETYRSPCHRRPSPPARSPAAAAARLSNATACTRSSPARGESTPCRPEQATSPPGTGAQRRNGESSCRVSLESALVRTIREIASGTHSMDPLRAFNFRRWIDEHRHLLKPPVGNKQVFQNSDFIIMVVGGPNSRKDYHVDPGDEFFYQLEGDMVLKTMQNGRAADVPIREGEILLLPARVPHSPQRVANTVGLVVERQRRPDELDGFQWYCEKCSTLLYEEFLHVSDIEKQLPPVFDRFFSSQAARTCKHCGSVMERPTPR